MDGIFATDLKDISSDPAVLSDGKFWAVLITFEGEMTFARFGKVQAENFPSSLWKQLHGTWNSSATDNEYVEYVESIRGAIAEGGVYQVNACRELSHPISGEQSLAGLFSKILVENPSRRSMYLKLPEIEIASATPERFLTRNGSTVLTSPIKGTIKLGESDFGDKDKAENLMIVDLMRNDLGQICQPGSVDVTELFRSEAHPGLVHLVSDVQGELRNDVSWSEILRATLPPGSVSGAPKSAALKVIEGHESRRGPYCGAIGWVHGHRADLSVAIRTFWKSGDGRLRFGTGAGITWGSNARSEWEETQLKARKLISIAGGQLS